MRHESYSTMLCLDSEPSFLLLPRVIERIRSHYLFTKPRSRFELKNTAVVKLDRPYPPTQLLLSLVTTF
ncbi:MAG: hypothetical protein JGK17_30675 [Microcoleus sp. PH2017_10_PVI_O_A]|uniref:hypothetical protein n=1 Tax=unclassified Microcoleus TaxID=2642155 RepID=UPI001D1EBF1D|nr:MULTISPECIES: hypothetical protein [unclassified Microcoleus]MCC3409830.1 hypothetical protein [Microcoleus sp. PH2017_10_PVI_O_A]MCC3464118.1 hypothetical protein [Microcoleus sp. PH2017_11_PCY_U_A]MCC3482449.1 hypothetical protein [Microcoleus sp. PH2017_12_PCY_D_A]MCC3532271.1 hypothetical protein [Microcoleus sp. PH2017_21_RUC_O_A]MCC3544553.1 hypothetical protein [Microcoleus sp. PH2017_22_RUC_O_B]